MKNIFLSFLALASSSIFAAEQFKGVIFQFHITDSITKNNEKYTIENSISLPPTQPPLTPKNIDELYLGQSYSLFIDENQNLWSVGDNRTFQLGRDDTITDWDKTSLTNITNITTGIKHSLSITDNGEVWSSGNNGYNNYINNDWINTNAPTKAVMIEVTQYNSYYIDENGDLYAKGANGHGQLGIGNQISSKTWVKSNISNVKKIVAANDKAFAIKNDNSLWVVGTNYQGVLGVSSLCTGVHCNTSNWIASENTTLVKDISVSNYTSLYLDFNNDIYAVGDSSQNKLGLMTGGIISSWTKMDTSFTSGSIKQIKVSPSSGILMLDSNSDLWGIGTNSHNVLGHPTGSTYYSKLTSWYKTIENVQYIMESSDTGTAVKKNDNTIFVTGNNWSNGLGMKNIPVTGLETVTKEWKIYDMTIFAEN